jgi:hypothetical protein
MPECGREMCLKEKKVTANIKSGIGPNEFLFMHGFVFWARVGGGTCVTQYVLRVVTCVQLKSPFCLCNFSSTLSRQLGVQIVYFFPELHLDASVQYLFSYGQMT